MSAPLSPQAQPMQYGTNQYAPVAQQSQYQQPPQYGQPQYGQPQYGQPQYGQPQYAQPQYQQPMYAQPSYNQVQPQSSPMTSAQASMMNAPNAATVLSPMGGAALAMAPPQAPHGTPAGLEYFSYRNQFISSTATGNSRSVILYTHASFVLVVYSSQLLDQFTQIEVNQKYQCLNNQGLQVYWAQENTDGCTRQCYGSSRPFLINIFDPTGRQAMRLSRPYRCAYSWCCCLPINFCCLQEMEVHDINGQLLGKVVQRFGPIHPTLDIQDATGTVLLTIVGPCLVHGCFGDVQFDLMSNGTNIGSIMKKWRGVFQESWLSNADNFACVFPGDLSITAKVKRNRLKI